MIDANEKRCRQLILERLTKAGGRCTYGDLCREFPHGVYVVDRVLLMMQEAGDITIDGPELNPRISIN